MQIPYLVATGRADPDPLDEPMPDDADEQYHIERHARQRLAGAEVARLDGRTPVRLHAIGDLARLTDVRPGPADRLLFAFVAERGVTLEAPMSEDGDWIAQVRAPGVAIGQWLVESSPDLRMALLALWRRYSQCQTPRVGVAS